MERQLLIDALAAEILQSHSFNFQTFEEAKHTISIGNDSIQYTYDRLSLTVYSHSLTKDEHSYLVRKLRTDYTKLFSREDEKRRKEYGVLLSFISLNDNLAEFLIQKEVRPDFVLSGDQCIGIEVTEFTTQTDSVMATICNQNFGKGLSAEAIENNAVRKHGQKAKNYYFHDIEGTVAIGAGLQDINHNKAIYAEEVITKYKKYKSEFGKYDEFIILCDARMTLGVTSQRDAKDVVDIAKEKCELQNCTICILYFDTLCCPQLETFVI